MWKVTDNIGVNISSIQCGNGTGDYRLNAEAVGILFVSRVVLCFLDLISMFLNMVLLLALWRLSNQQHANIRIILSNISVAAIAMNCNQFVKTVYFFVLLYTKPTGISQVHQLCTSESHCILWELLKTTAVRTTVVFIVGTAVERLVAVKYHATYEQWSCRLGIGICFLTWLQAIFGSASAYIYSRDDVYVPYCSVLVVIERHLLAVLVFVYFLIGLIGFVCYLEMYRESKLLLANFVDHQKQLSLSSRLQIRHNISFTLLLLPSVVVHLVIWAFVVVYATALKFGIFKNLSNSTTTALLSLVDLQASLYFVLHAVILIHRSDKIRQQFFSILASFPIFNRIAFVVKSHSERDRLQAVPLVDQPRNIGHDVHFEFLNNLWEQRAPTPKVSAIRVVTAIQKTSRSSLL